MAISGETTTTTTSKPTTTTSTTSEPPQPLKRYYNADGALTITDAVMLARFAGEDTELTKVQINAVLNVDPDYDGDGLVTVMDVYALLKNLEHK